MSDDTRLDDELANLTDALLEGREMQTSTGRHDLEQVVRQLHQTLLSGGPPDPAYRARLEQRLIQEWNRVYRAQRWYQRRAARALALAAALVFALLALILALPATGAGALHGAAAGALSWEAALALVVLLGLAALIVFVWVWRRRR